MYKFIDGRGTGKTRKLVETAVINNGVIVCENTKRMTEKVSAYGFDRIKIISYDDFIDLIITHSIKDNNYYIDELERFVRLIGINGFTLIPENE